MPATVAAAGGQARYEASMERSAGLYGALAQPLPAQSSYAVALAYRVRYVMHMNAREAMHLIELRTGPQGHPEYRRVAQAMHRLIAEEAGHRVVAEVMRFADHADYEDAALERLASERRAATKRGATPRSTR
jgi:thymidylate synthase ThyX